MLTTTIIILACAGTMEPVKLNLVAEGGMSKLGWYMPQRLTLTDQKPDAITALPEGLKAPVFGIIPIGPEGAPGVALVLDEPAGEPARLWLDTNRNGNLADDAPAEWTGKASPGRDGNQYTTHSGKGRLTLAAPGSTGPVVALGMYRFDKADPQRAALASTLLYYRDYIAQGEVKLGEKTYNVMLSDEMTAGDFRGKAVEGDAPSGVTLIIDRNANGKIESRGEKYDARKPFNIDGVTYEIAGLTADGLTFEVVKSSKEVAEVPLPPDHSVGKKITPFIAKDTQGNELKFPEDFKGKVVMLDFWATWCGPCMAEVPGLVKVYEAYKGKGFDVLGISLDNEQSVSRLKPVTEEQGMAWRQVCDSKGWQAEIAALYVVNSIPACWLVDGDTGIILAEEGALRGEQLQKTVEKALADKARPGGA